MPKIKIDHIVSFGSEDPVHTANNILLSDTSKKWKCRAAGEKNAVVVLQLEKASVITGIDIGNEHSAYIEVLVSRSGTNDDYKVLLVTSAFMTPLESRQSQNVNKVRMFKKEDFSKPECDEKWDRVKIVCTQPFNRHVQYGLSFINLHTSDEQKAAPIQSHIGKFVLRPESPDNLSPGSLFEKRKGLKKEEKLSGAAAIREASSSSSLALYGSPVCKPKLKTQNTNSSVKDSSGGSSTPPSRPRNRDELLYSKDEEEPHEKIDKIIEKKAKEQKADNEKTPKQKVKDDSSSSSKKDKKENGVHSPKPLDISVTSSKTSDKDRKRRHKGEIEKKHKKPKNEKLTKPFSKLLEGVTLVISGIQNPDRANLRASALSMGAKYKPDWDDSCTHLICAFPNTPKFQQVRGKGKIVKRTWIEDCHSQRKKLPWRRYALDKNDIGKDESEEEICEKVSSESPVYVNSDTEIDIDEHNDEGSDTEERIAKIKESQKNKQKENLHQNNVYSADTDEETPMPKASTSPHSKLRNLFNSKKFYIDQSLDIDTYNNLQKYIAAYNGKFIDDPTADIDIIVTEKGSSQTLKEVNADATCLSPDWIWDCHNSQKLVPMDEYIF